MKTRILITLLLSLCITSIMQAQVSKTVNCTAGNLSKTDNKTVNNNYNYQSEYLCKNNNSTRQCGYCNGTGKCPFCNSSGQSLACVANRFGANCTDSYCIAKNHRCKHCDGTHICSNCKGTGNK